MSSYNWYKTALHCLGGRRVITCITQHETVEVNVEVTCTKQHYTTEIDV